MRQSKRGARMFGAVLAAAATVLIQKPLVNNGHLDRRILRMSIVPFWYS
jgi:hypothetical protein